MENSDLDTTYLDKLNPAGYCPGFNLWNVLATDGKRYLMASDHEGGLGTRLYFRTNGRLDVESAELIGPNPDAAAWNKARGMN
jgi:hypothetical protein